MRIEHCQTPCLLLERPVLERNIERMKSRMRRLGVRLRPHMKTCKSGDIAALLRDEKNPGITVSTLKEAEYFLEHGITDMMYAVGIVPARLERVAQIQRQGARVSLILDSMEVARAVSVAALEYSTTYSVFIEIDTDGHRAGLVPDDPLVVEIGRFLSGAPGVEFRGVMTHAGESYECRGKEALIRHAEQERSRCVNAAERMREAGVACDEVSVGSTPTATFAQNLKGVTECRPGVFVFHDLFQAGIGVCETSDIALSVLTTVTGHKKDQNWFLVDAGGMALSKDRSTADLEPDAQFGLVCDARNGAIIPGYRVIAANQEHGLVSVAEGEVDFARFPIGSQVRILPNHACMTAAAHDRYFVVDGDDRVSAAWDRCNGW